MADYIRREDALKALQNNFYSTAMDIINRVPVADVAEVVHGRWIPTHDEFCQCSICKYPTYIAWNMTKYCPNCGAMMDGGAKND